MVYFFNKSIFVQLKIKIFWKEYNKQDNSSSSVEGKHVANKINNNVQCTFAQYLVQLDILKICFDQFGPLVIFFLWPSGQFYFLSSHWLITCHVSQYCAPIGRESTYVSSLPVGLSRDLISMTSFPVNSDYQDILKPRYGQGETRDFWNAGWDI